MNKTVFTDKEIDESRQGEAIQLETSGASNGKKLFLESYGCAMNFADSEVVASILAQKDIKQLQMKVNLMLY